MIKEKTPLILLTFLIALGAISQLARLLWNIPITIGSLLLPGWTGAIGYVILGLLSAAGFRSLFFGHKVVPLLDEKTEEQPPHFP